MINELDRANSILTEFLALAKDRTINLKEHKLNQIIQTLYPLMLVDALNADKNIVLETQDVKEILVDEKEIRQLILNLVRNALEAMPSGGTVALRTYMDDYDVVLAVRDNGSGIKEEIIGQLGKPFLSTKEQGTGLGLAICYSIAARHHAAIDFETGDSGTTFFVRFKVNPYCSEYSNEGDIYVKY